MTQNTSHAVMAQRHDRAPDALDHFPTPPWAARALIEHVLTGHGWRQDQLARQWCWEPACGTGEMLNGLDSYFYGLWGSDVHDYGTAGAFVHDFLFPSMPRVMGRDPVDWIITNPPFRLAVPFIERGREIATEGVAMLVRTVFLEGGGRYRDLFSKHPPLIFAPFCERVPMVKGRLDRKASSATSYAWFVWPGTGHIRTQPDTRLVWIPPCRKALERDEDYG